MNISDILIHINQPLSQEQQATLEASIRELEGVVAPRFNPGMNHLLLVAFNPASVSSSTLLSKVYSLGYEAQLIGA